MWQELSPPAPTRSRRRLGKLLPVMVPPLTPGIGPRLGLQPQRSASVKERPRKPQRKRSGLKRALQSVGSFKLPETLYPFQNQLRQTDNHLVRPDLFLCWVSLVSPKRTERWGCSPRLTVEGADSVSFTSSASPQGRRRDHVARAFPTCAYKE